jgi:hypothetical protein
VTINARGDAFATPAPAVYLPGRGPRVGAALTPVLAVVGVVVGTVGLAYEAVSGFAGTGHRFGQTVPMWGAYGVILVASVVVLVRRARRAPWYRGWSMVEMQERPDGLVLFVGRLGARHEGLSVRRGETVMIAASGGLRSNYQYVVSAPSGSMTFAADGFIHKLTMEPLDEAAARHAITVVTSGDAERIARKVVA